MKKVLSLVLALALVFGLSAVAFSAIVDKTNKIVDFAVDLESEFIGSVALIPNGDWVTIATLNPAHFEWKTGTPAAADFFSPKHLDDIKITVSKKDNYDDAIRDIRIKIIDTAGVGGAAATQTAEVQVRPIKYLVETTDDFSGKFDVKLSLKGAKEKQTAATVEFETGNTLIEVEGEEVEESLDGNYYVEATARAPFAVLCSDEGLTFIRTLGKGVKVYVRVNTEPSAADEKLFDEFKELDSVYNVIQKGLDAAQTKARWDDLDGDAFYVYNAEFKLLGTTKDEVAFSKKYYLTTEQVNLAGEEEVEPAESTPPLGGEGPVEGNTFNPNTGK